jgi:hypothetical protein
MSGDSLSEKEAVLTGTETAALSGLTEPFRVRVQLAHHLQVHPLASELFLGEQCMGTATDNFVFS